jgi:hypothetical protein
MGVGTEERISRWLDEICDVSVKSHSCDLALQSLRSIYLLSHVIIGVNLDSRNEEG